MDNELRRWISVVPSDLEGQGWKDTVFPFDRLPRRAQGRVPDDIWNMGQSTTGMCVFFQTDSSSIAARWTLGLEQLGSESFNLCSFSGVDLYGYDETSQTWRWAGAPGFQQIADRHPEVELRTGLPPKKRRWRLYLPLRNRLEKLEIGIDAEAEWTLIPPRSVRPLVYYGSSIIHGAYAGRAGLGVPNLLARRLDRPLINLGFSGAARMEESMATLLAELDPEFFLIDPLPNMTFEPVSRNAEKFIEVLGTAKAQTDIFMISDAPLTYSWLYPSLQAEFTRKNEAYRKIYRRLKPHYPKLHYLDGREFFGVDGEGTTDGIHPNDCGFMRMTEVLERKIRRVFPRR